MTTSPRLRTNIVANYLGQGWVALMGLAFIPAYIRHLGMEAWGLVGFMSMLQAWLTLLDMGLTPALSREMARYRAGAHTAQSIRDLLRSMELVYGGLAFAIIFLVWCLAPWLATAWLKLGQLPVATVIQAIQIMGLVIAARMAEQVYRGAMQGLQHQVWLNAAQAVLATLRWAGAIGVLVWVSPTIEAFFLWQGTVSIITVAVLAMQTYRCLPDSDKRAVFDFEGLRKIGRFASGRAAVMLLGLMLTQIDKLFLSRLLALEQFGYYTFASAVAAALYFLVSPISNATLPRLTELVTRAEQDALIETYHRASQWMAAILIPPVLVIASFPQQVLFAWSGNPVVADHAAPILAPLVLGTLCSGFMSIPFTLQLAHGWTSFAIRINIVALCFIAPAILWAVPRYGAIGAAWAWFALNAGYVLIGMHFAFEKPLSFEKWRWYRHAIIRPLLAGSVLALMLRHFVTLPEGRAGIAMALVVMGLGAGLAVCLSLPEAKAALMMRMRRQRPHQE